LDIPERKGTLTPLLLETLAMSQSVRHRVEGLRVIDDAGRTAEFRKITPIVTETMLDGSVMTFERNATITTPSGEHVNRRSDSEFETLSGVRWKLTR